MDWYLPRCPARSQVIDAFLNAGWTVRGTVRSMAKAEHLLSRYPDHADKLSLVEVPDLVTGEGLDEAVKGVDAIAHTASASRESRPPSCAQSAAVELLPYED